MAENMHWNKHHDRRAELIFEGRVIAVAEPAKTPFGLWYWRVNADRRAIQLDGATDHGERLSFEGCQVSIRNALRRADRRRARG